MLDDAATVSLPEGASLRRVAEILLDAWEAGAHQWRDTPLLLRDERAGASTPAPLPQDTLDLFRLLHERRVDYLLVGGMAMLTYIQGRNTKDVDLLMSVADMESIPELRVEARSPYFVRGRFRSLQVDLLLTSNPFFELVKSRFATRHRFVEMDVPAATVEGLIALKLYALPSLYRQHDLDRAAIYETDITMLLARHTTKAENLLGLVNLHVEQGDKTELGKILGECTGRANRLRRRARM
jgi:hypothetical protein